MGSVPLALVALVGCATTAGTGPLAGPALMRDVAVLADPELLGRDAGSPGERAAADHVAAALRAIGLEPERQELDWPAGSANVYALLPGTSEEVIVIGAHLDHLGMRRGRIYSGADDNASGVAIALGLARELAGRRGELRRSVMFVFFGAEERGLAGSKQFVAAPPVPLHRIVAMINLDMIGRPLLDQRLFRVPMFLVGVDRDRSVGLVGLRWFPGLRALVDRAFGDDHEVVAPEDFPDLIGDEIERQSDGRSDSAPFERAGIPALFFGDGESRDYHRPTDTIDKLSPAILERRARAIARVALALSTAPTADFARHAATPRKRKPRPGIYVPIGIELGGVIDDGAHLAIGATASIVYFRPVWFAGIATDVVRAGGASRYAIGPAIGVGPFGVELDMVFAHGSRGVAGRVAASLGAVGLSLRAGEVEDRGWFGDLVLNLSFPLFVH